MKVTPTTSPAQLGQQIAQNIYGELKSMSRDRVLRHQLSLKNDPHPHLLQRASTHRVSELTRQQLDAEPKPVQKTSFNHDFSQVPASKTRKNLNHTGMPDRLKTGLESLSGFDLSDVRVHYNSPKPASLQAFAYAQGSDIFLAPGQEKHLPHEGWHVAQQRQGRVRPTLYKNGTAINNDSALEAEADVMGNRANQAKPESAPPIRQSSASVTPSFVQRAWLYRGMQADAPNGAVPLLGNDAGFKLGVRDNEVTVAGELAQPATGGMSTSNDTAVPGFTVSTSYPGGAHGTINQATQPFRWKWRIDDAQLPATLTTRNDHDNHVMIEPQAAMTLGNFRNAVQGTQGQWQRIAPP